MSDALKDAETLESVAGDLESAQWSKGAGAYALDLRGVAERLRASAPSAPDETSAPAAEAPEVQAEAPAEAPLSARAAAIQKAFGGSGA